MEYLTLFFQMLGGHALADYALQSDWVAKNKARSAGLVGGQVMWPYVLGSHALIHGLAVAVITGSAFLGMLETVFHAVIDFGKCERRYGIHADQFLHVLCKLVWLVYPGLLK